MASSQAIESCFGLKAPSLFAVFVLAKILALAGRDLSLSIWTLPAYLWQDLLLAICFGVLERVIKRPWLSSLIYMAVVLYIAINVPLVRLLATPMTWPMMHAARGTLADSIKHHLTSENLVLMSSIGIAGLLLPRFFNSRQFHRVLASTWDRIRGRLTWLFGLLGVSFLVFGPIASSRLDTAGLHRNPCVTLIESTFPRIASQPADQDWRKSPFGSPGRSELSHLRGAAAGRNVVMILLESTRAQYLKLYGAPDDPMPHLTTLAEKSIVVESAYAVYPESIKGLFSVLCSRYPALDTKAELYSAVPTDSIAHVLSGAGYQTALFHSGRFMYLGMEAIVQNRGYQTLEDAGEIGGQKNSSFGVDEPSTVRRILRWIDSLQPSDKFFLTYLPIAGHHPYDAPEGGPFSSATEIERYRNALHYGDAALGELLEGLRQRHRYDNTLFVIFGDHGEAFGQHEGNFGHTLSIYEENIRVPYLIAAPGLFEDQIRLGTTASLIDTAPTILDLLGLKIPAGCQGFSLLCGTNPLALFYADYSLALLGLRDGNWKCIHELESGRSKLFDLVRDPNERENLALKHPARVNLYREHLLRWSAAQRELITRNASGPSEALSVAERADSFPSALLD